jgi:hypothetical protein
MNRKEHREKSSGVWRALHGALWLVGLAVLAWTDSWWPGILILIALSVVLEAILARRGARTLPETIRPTGGTAPGPEKPTAPLAATPEPVRTPPADWLPASCTRCGGPIRETEVKWISPRSAECPFCGTILVAKGP